jgi:hypothetical protein
MERLVVHSQNRYDVIVGSSIESEWEGRGSPWFHAWVLPRQPSHTTKGAFEIAAESTVLEHVISLSDHSKRLFAFGFDNDPYSKRLRGREAAMAVHHAAATFGGSGSSSSKGSSDNKSSSGSDNKSSSDSDSKSSRVSSKGSSDSYSKGSSGSDSDRDGASSLRRSSRSRGIGCSSNANKNSISSSRRSKSTSSKKVPATVAYYVGDAIPNQPPGSPSSHPILMNATTSALKSDGPDSGMECTDGSLSQNNIEDDGDVLLLNPSISPVLSNGDTDAAVALDNSLTSTFGVDHTSSNVDPPGRFVLNCIKHGFTGYGVVAFCLTVNWYLNGKGKMN